MFLYAFRQYFIPEEWRDEKMAKFLELTQGDRTVLQCMEKFTELVHFAPLIAGDDETKAEKL